MSGSRRGGENVKRIRAQAKCRRQRGSVAVEFAFVAPFLVLILGVIAETAGFMIIQYQLQLATTKYGREVQLRKITDKSSFKTEICNFMGVPNSRCDGEIHVDVRLAPKFAALPTRSIANVDSDQFDPITPGQACSVIVTKDWRFIFPFMGDFSLLFPGSGMFPAWNSGVGFANVPGRTDIRRLYGISTFVTEQ